VSFGVVYPPPVESRWRASVVPVLLLLALAAVCFYRVRPTNFAGYDEWVCLSLLSRGILSFPYANRPLNLVWTWPATALAPDRLPAVLLVHVAWIALTGVLVFLLARRLLPRSPAFAFLAGAFAIVWGPSDLARLSPVQMSLYSGCTFGVMLTTLLAVEAWRRSHWLLAAAAAAAGLVTVLSIEAALAPLALLPLLFLADGGARTSRRWMRWTTVCLLLLLAAGLRVAVPLLTQPERLSYQSGTALPRVSPRRLVRRLLGQVHDHLAPVATIPAVEVASLPIVVAGMAVFASGLVLARRLEDAPPRRALLLAMGLGLVWALAAYAPFLPARTTQGPYRLQFLSAPGIAAFLAGAIVLVATLLPPRARRPVAGLLGAWIVGLGIAHTLRLQAQWDEMSAYPAQRRVLRELAATVPDPAPGTLLVLIAGSKAWPYDFSFHHAVSYLYEDRVDGHVVGVESLMYPARFGPQGISIEPATAVREPWREPSRLFGYSELVVLREEATLALCETWPDDLPPLPADAVYAPRRRLGAGPPPRRLEILAAAR
jgi:hypothetical protein